ncbi:MAG: hypothetical protein HC919_06770 [Oscillatoriales cyanobacterium SM2_2_1]|nr:hypothetical protein [Oscillatoriales cyanobacterium SM2_2_1]
MRAVRYLILSLLTYLLIVIAPLQAQVSPASINKNFVPSTINPGQTSRLSVTIFNSDVTTALTNTSLTDPLPTGVTVANPPNITNTCGGTVTAAPGGNSFTLNGGTVPPKTGGIDGECTFSVLVTTIRQGNNINTIPANTLTNAQGRTNATPASATLTVRTVANPNLSKSFAPNTIFLGETSQVELRIRNQDNTVPLTGVSLTDSLPAGIRIASPPNISFPGCGTPTVTAPAGGTTIQITGATIAPATNCNVRVTAEGTTQGLFNNTLAAGDVTTNQGVTNAQPATTPLSVQVLGGSKAFSPASISPGGVSRLTITLQNGSTSPQTGVAFTDTFPANLTLANPPNASTTCPAGTISATAGGTSFSFNGGTIPARVGSTRGECTISVNTTSPVTGDRDNNIPIGAITSAQGFSNQIALTSRLTVSNITTPEVAKSFNPSNNVGQGQNIELRIDITNRSRVAPLTGVSLTDVLPSQLTIDSAGTTDPDCQGGTISFSNTPPPPRIVISGLTIPFSSDSNTTCRITAIVRANADGESITNTIPGNSLTTNQGVTDGNNRTATVNVRSFDVGKAFQTSPVAVGVPVRLRVTLTNRATSNLTNLTFTDNLPAGLQIATPPSASTNCGGTLSAAAGATSFSLSGGSILAANPGGTRNCLVDVNVIGTAPGSYTNTIPGGTATGTLNGNTVSDPNNANATLVVGGVINVTKSFSPTTIAAGNPTTLTLTLSNPLTNPVTGSDVTGLALTDTFPANLIVANPPNASTSCTSGAVTAVAGANSVALGGGSLLRGASCTVTVNVTSTVAATLTNTVPLGSVTTTQGFTNTVEATANLTIGSGIALAKDFTPNEIPAGGRSILRLVVTNTRPTPITNLQIFDDFNNNNASIGQIRIASPVVTSTTCAGGVFSPPPVAGQDSFTFVGGTVPAQVGGVPGICTITIETTRPNDGTDTNTVLSTNVNNDQNARPPANASANLTATGFNFPVNKEFDPLTVSGGSASTLTVTLTNPSNQTYFDIDFTDNLPTGLILAAVPNPVTTCPDGGFRNPLTLTANPGASSFRLTGADLPPNSTCTLSVQVTSTIIGTQTNVIPINGVTTFQGVRNAEAAEASLTNLPGIGLSKSFVPSLLGVNEVSRLTIVINNQAAVDVEDLALTDAFPAGLVIANPPNASNTCGGTLTANPGGTALVLANGSILVNNANCAIAADVVSSSAGTFVNEIPIGAVTVRNNVATNRRVESTVRFTNRPTVAKSFNPTLINPGGVATLTIQLGNTDTTPATLTVNLVDTLPSGLAIADPNTLSGTCTLASVSALPGGTNITYAAGAQIPVGGCTIVVNVTGASGGTFTNTIPANGLQTTLGNNLTPATATLSIGGPPNLLLVKRITAVNGSTTNLTSFVDETSGPNAADDNNPLWPAGYLIGGGTSNPADPFITGAIAIRPGDILDYTVYFLNAGQGLATNVRVCDRLEPQLEFVPTSFNGQSPNDGGIIPEQGIALAVGSTTPTAFLSNINDPPDRGQFVATPTVPPNCNTSDNPNGTVVVNVTRTTGSPTLPQVPNATAPGTPPTSFGFVRFRSRVR